MFKPRRRQVTPLVVAAALFVALIGTAVCGDSAPVGEQPLINIDVKDAPVEQVLRMLAKAANVNILIGQDVKGTVEAVALRDVTVDAALRLIARTQGFFWYRDGNVYVVSKQPPAPDTLAVAGPSATALPAVSAGTTAAPAPALPIPGNSGAVALPPAISAPQVAPDAAVDGPKLVTQMIPLGFADAREIALMFGGTVWSGGSASGTFGELGTPPSRRHQSMSRGGRKSGGAAGPEVFGNGFNTPKSGNGGALGWGQDFGGQGGGTTGGGRGTTGGNQSGGVGGRTSGGGSGGGVLDNLLPGDMQPPVAFMPQNALLVAGTQEDIDKFREILDLLDKPAKQVEIATKFVEVQTTQDSALGIDWSMDNGSLAVRNNGFAPGTQQNIVTFARGRFEATLTALLSSGRATVINEPHVITMNNQFAEINFLTTVPYFSAQISYNQFGNRTVDYTDDEVDIENSLWVVPRINADDSITVYLEPTLEDQIGTVVGPDGTSIPITTSQYVSTQVRVADGETIVLGGLIRKDESTNSKETPLLSRIPIIGKLFRSQNVAKRNSELLIFVTPRIVRDVPKQ